MRQRVAAQVVSIDQNCKLEKTPTIVIQGDVVQ